MKSLLSLMLILAFQNANAESFKTKISSIIQSEDGRNPHLLLLENGQVAKIPADEKSSLIDFEQNVKEQKWIKVDLDAENMLVGMSSLEEEKQLNPLKPNRNTSETYTPTNLASMDLAEGIFKLQSRRYQRSSQCYNRAHVWAFEEWKRSGLKSMKLFMFFTKRYIWDYNYKWWFHVTPMTYVNNEGMTLDRQFFKTPINIKDWTLKFIYSKRDCPVVQKYSDYENNQETEHCYLIPVSMYYWQPRDIYNFEQTGFEKTDWVKKEVDWAYWEAF